MKTSDLYYPYPERLIATEPQGQFRALSALGGVPEEISKETLLAEVSPGDALVINDTQVSPRRVFTSQGLEVLFLNYLGESQWEVLFPAKKVKDGEKVSLPGGPQFQLVKRGLPQIIKVNELLTSEYFAEFGELALPPYIQAARGERHMRKEDLNWYQTAWAKNEGSSAAPTASLHFSNEDLEKLAAKGVSIVPLTLHVGLGTFLPVKTENLSDHKMHCEEVSISNESLRQITAVKESGGKVWALGTTSTRALESWAHGKLNDFDGGVRGATDLFITPGFEFKVVDRLLTNFHQPESTLLALVMAFAGKEKVLNGYKVAIENEFKLFSYGNLSVWKRA